MLLRSHPWLTLGVGALALISGALSAAFAALVGLLVDGLPAAVREADPGAVTGVLVAIGIVLTVQPAAAAVQELLSTHLYWRHNGTLLSRVMTTATSGHTLALHEDPELAARTDRAARIATFGPGELVSGLNAQWTARAEGAFATLLVASVSPQALLALVPAWLLLARFLRADLYRANPFWTDPLRRADYLKRLGLRPDAAKEIRIFGLTGWLVDRFGAEWARVLAELWRARRVGRRTVTLLIGCLLAAHLAVLLLAARAAVDGALTVAQLTVLLQGVFGMAKLASMDGDIWIENGAVPVPDVLDHERTVAERLDRERPERPEQPARAADRLPERPPERAIRLESVGFGYPGGQRVYEALDLTIEAGRSLAVVGLNGAGKTTLVKLLSGLWAPDSGRVLIDDVDLRDVIAEDPERWRRRLAVVFQDFVRFPLTAAENVGLGADPSATPPPNLLARAADRAGSSEFVTALPAGWETPLSRRYAGGLDLSGGQWQRIALARAMAAVEAGARVLVLDEPTAQQDARAEAELYDRFLAVTSGLTSIVISHRFSTVRRADRIVVLSDGAVAEDGTHDELVEAGGRYAALFRAQARRYREDG